MKRGVKKVGAMIQRFVIFEWFNYNLNAEV